MGSEDFGRATAAVMEVDAKSTVAGPSARLCSSFVTRNDEGCALKASDSSSWHKIPANEPCMHSSELYFHDEEVSEQILSRSSTSKCNSLTPRPVGAQLQPRADKTQVARQKRSYSKRGDKINSKVHMKCKNDSFPVKAEFGSFSSASAENNVIGIPGQKDVSDLTELVENLSLDELLDGSYKQPNLAKSNVRTDKNINENTIQSARKACSLLQLTKLLLHQTSPVIDSCSNNKISTSDNINGDNGYSCITHQSSSNKDYCHNLETSGNLLDFPSYEPKDILEHLELPPSKKLQELLLDATIKVARRKTSESRPDKHISCGASLQPFPWSHVSIGQSRMNLACTIEVSKSRKTCQDKWVRIGNAAGCLGVVTNSVIDLESLTYDQALVPSGKLKMGNYETIVPSASDKRLLLVGNSSSWATCSYAFHAAIEHGSEMNYQESVGRCPRLLAAAQTLYGMSKLRQKPMGTISWSSMKA